MTFARAVLIKGILTSGAILLLVMVCFYAGLDLFEHFSVSDQNAVLFGPESWMALFFERIIWSISICIAGGTLIGMAQYFKNTNGPK